MHSLVADFDPAFVHQIFDISKRRNRMYNIIARRITSGPVLSGTDCVYE